MEEKQLEELHEGCSRILDRTWQVEDELASAIINEQTRIIRDLIDIIKDHVSK